MFCQSPKDTRKPIDVLYYFKTMDGCFSNAWIAYRIMLTIPEIVASGQRSISVFGQPCLKRRGIQMETFQMKDLIINLIIRSLAVAFFKKLEWRMEDVSN